MKEKGLQRSWMRKFNLRPTYYLLHFSHNVVVTTKNGVTALFSFIVKYLQNKSDVVR